ncbi:hypothetical protein ACFQY5_03930 [Paeniroseomonas aquatica]|uniref:hypothetical protein n=1 Tax=Paeniroseomonas aquatica TaxID=373043 RepID=UPI003618D473
MSCAASRPRAAAASTGCRSRLRHDPRFGGAGTAGRARRRAGLAGAAAGQPGRIPAPGRTPASAFLLRELQSGAATTLLLAAIEGAPKAELARLSRETAAGLRASGQFGFVGDGTLRLGEPEEALLFRYRYLLSPETRPEAFTAAALRPKLEALLDGLRSAASPILARYGFADPTGAFLGLAAAWLGESRVATEDGAWFAPGDNPRALLVARGQGAGLDAAAQRLAMTAFHQAFAAATPRAPGCCSAAPASLRQRRRPGSNATCSG